MFLAIAIALNISPLSAQWEQCNGTAGLNMQSLLTKGTSNFAGGHQKFTLKWTIATSMIMLLVGLLVGVIPWAGRVG